MHAPDGPAEVRVRRLRAGLLVDAAMLSSGHMYSMPRAVEAAFGPEERLGVTERGVALGPVSHADADAVWLEGGGLSSPRIVQWKPANGQLVRLGGGEAIGNPLHVLNVAAAPPTEPTCAEQAPSQRFGWSDTVLLSNELRVDKVAPGAEPACRVLEVTTQGAGAKIELCPGPSAIREGDVVRIALRDTAQMGEGPRSRILMIETARETIWMVRGASNDLSAVLAPMGIQSLSWSQASSCGLSAADGCGVGGLPAQVQVAFKPGDRSFTLRAGETVRGHFGGAPVELQVVRAAFRPFRSAQCAYDGSDFGLVLTRSGPPIAKATIAR